MDLSFIHISPFYQLAALLTLAAGVGFIGQFLRQPMVVSFIAVGVLAGPSVLGLVESRESIELLADLGVVVLLFLVGLKLDLSLIRTLGGVSLATGLGQVFFTSIIGFFIGLALGFDLVTATYVAVALTFSSTIIIVKLLSDKKEVDALHGRIAIGLLIVQDLVVVVAMMALAAFGVGAQTGDEGDPLVQIGLVAVYGFLTLLFVLLFIRYLATPLMARIARSSELLVTFAIAWTALLAMVGDHFGFSQELGGLLAGMSLASTPYREAIVARLSTLRDFLLLFFFIGLGAQIDMNVLGGQVLPALIFSLFVLLGHPLIVMGIMGVMGYRKHTSFMTGLTVAQISEFSLIFIAMGLTLGHVTNESLGLVTLVGLITIALSVYMITYSQTLYSWMEPYLGLFERKNPVHNGDSLENKGYDLILFGVGRYGSALAERLRRENFRILAVDFNPDEVRQWRNLGYDVIYGDGCDHEFISSLPLDSVKWVVSAMPQHELGLTHEDPRLALIDGLRQQGYRGKIAVSAQRPLESAALRAKGADLVFLPFLDAADRAVEQIKASAAQL